MESRAAKTVREIFESGRPLTYIRSPEEQRVARVLREVGRRAGLVAGAGLDLEPYRGHASGRRGCGRGRNGNAARGALDFIIAHPGPGHLPPEGFSRAAARIGRDPAPAARCVRELPGQRKFVVITSPVRFIPEEMERSMLFLELRPPDRDRAGGVPARRDAGGTQRGNRCSSWRARCWG